MRPILFNTEMVRAILDGRKTVTRRLVKPQPPMPYCHEIDGEWFFTSKDADDDMMDWWPSYENGLRPPYRPGDILYVRETWSRTGNGYLLYRAWPGPKNEPEKQDEAMKRLHLKWHPSIHMPKEAARLFLRVKDVRVEQLQKVGTDGAIKEGVANSHIAWLTIKNFADLWDSTIKPADRALYGWEANPWVWVIEFERITKKEAKHD